MIGIAAIIMDSFFLALALFMFLASLWDLRLWRSRPRNIYHKRNFGQATPQVWVAMALMFFLAIFNAFFHEIHFHSDLEGLRAENVQQIQIDQQAVTNREQIDTIVAVLTHPQWFSMGRADAAADRVPFIIRFKDGTRREYHATTYQQGAGIIVESVSPWGMQNGSVFYLRLPEALQKAGIALPPCFTVQGKPVHCAPALSTTSANR